MELGRNLESDGVFLVNRRFREGGACTTSACYARVNVGSSCVLLIRDQPESDTWKGPVSDDTWPNPLLPRGTNVFHHNRRPFPAIGAVFGDGYRRPTGFRCRFRRRPFFRCRQIFRRLFRRPTIFSGNFSQILQPLSHSLFPAGANPKRNDFASPKSNTLKKYNFVLKMYMVFCHRLCYSYIIKLTMVWGPAIPAQAR